MDKAINGNGWGFTPATADKPAIWAGKDSIYNRHHLKQVDGNITIVFVLFLLGAISIPFIGIQIVFPTARAIIGDKSTAEIITVVAIFALYGVGIRYLIPLINRTEKLEWLGAEWQLVASGDGLTYYGESSGFVSFDEVTRIESGQTVEWQKVREYGGKPASIPDAEYQVFLFLDDGRRLVVHTANAGREDCGRLAHSIRAYVETQRGNAAPSPSSSDTSSAAADGFDL